MHKSTILGIICIIISLAFFVIYLLKFTNGISDSFYLRFTTPKQSSLILGTSRAAQGIVPEVFNTSDFNFNKNLFNFSFTDGQSLFGSIYLDAIRRKLNLDTENGLFIIEVSPISISELKIENNNSKKFVENGSFLEIKDVNEKPNLEYIFHYYSEPYYTLLYLQIRNNINSILRPYIKGFQNYSVILHEDGWLEVTVTMDSISVNERYFSRNEEYLKDFSQNQFSQYRYNYLEKTIELLQAHGRVVLVRLPIGKKLFELENIYMPDFNDKINTLSIKYRIPYLTFKNEYLTTDGNHLYKTDSKRVSEEILRMIKLHD